MPAVRVHEVTERRRIRCGFRFVANNPLRTHATNLNFGEWKWLILFVSESRLE